MRISSYLYEGLQAVNLRNGIGRGNGGKGEMRTRRGGAMLEILSRTERGDGLGMVKSKANIYNKMKIIKEGGTQVAF